MTMPSDEVVREAIDPCPFASRVAALHAWQHGAHAVRCSWSNGEHGCGRVGLRFAWYMGGGGHACGRCHARAVADGGCPSCL